MKVSSNRLMAAAISAVLLSLLMAVPASAQLIDYFGGKNKVNYDTFDWRRYETDHFIIHYYPEAEEYLDEVVNWAETSYEILSQRLNHQLSIKIPIIFFKTHSEFEQQNVIPMFLPEGVGAFAEPRRNRLLIPLDDPPQEMQRLFTHELTHAFQYDILQAGFGPGQLFQRPPLWVMEGMAEYMADGLNVMDEMLLRDAVVNDFVPTLEQIANAGGFYIPYVYGNVIYNYMAEQYGEGSIKNFIWELRKNGASQGGVERAVNELFKIDSDKFSRQFRQWLRDKYLPALVEKEEPEEYGEMIRSKDFDKPVFSPVPSPSGDLVACLSFDEGDIDLMLISTKDGTLFRNLTPGYSDRYEYLIGQGVTSKFIDGKDIAWSPDGRYVAVFARQGKNRDLLLIDAVNRSIYKQITVQADQALNPSFSPDGTKILLSASKDGVRDIYQMEIATGNLLNLTEDDAFDYAPIYSPDGRTIVYTSVADGVHTKLFSFAADRPETKTQLTYGAFHDKQPSFSPDGKKLLYISSETGIYNIYSYDMATGAVAQYTDVLGGAFMPAFDLISAGKGKIYFQGFLKQQYHLYTMNLAEPIRSVDTDNYKRESAERAVGFTPIVQVPLDEDAKGKQPKFDWSLDDVFLYGGVASDGTVLTIAQARFADMFGDENLTVVFNTVSDLRSYVLQYFNQRKRLNWGVTLYDNNTYLAGNPNIFNQPSSILVERTTVENLGVSLFTRYPINKFLRVEFFTGFNNRTYVFDSLTLSNIPPSERGLLDERFSSGNFVYLGTQIVGDNARFNPAFGPIAGRRWELTAQFAPGFGDGDFLSYQTFTGEVRNYLKLSDSTLIATRIFGGYSSGEAPDVFVFGGLNTLRGADFLSLVGNRAFYMNNEFRFPVVNFAALPLGINVANIRGSLFWDLGAAYYKDEEFTFMEDGRLKDAISSVGFGVNLNFILPLNFSWSKSWDFKDFGDEWKFNFWIGPTF